MPPQHVPVLAPRLFWSQPSQGFDAPETRGKTQKFVAKPFLIKSWPPFIKLVSRNLEEMERLSIWLLFVGFCRLSAVYFGFFDVWALHLAVYSRLKTSKFFSTPFAIKATYIMAIAIAFDVGENTFVIAKCGAVCIYPF